MKKSLFLGFFVATQLFFIFFHIHKQSRIIKLSYQKQKNEKIRISLLEKKQELKEKIEALHNLNSIKKFAKANNMVPINIKQIESISNLESISQ